MKIKFLALIFGAALSVQAQLENTIWYFGNSLSGIQFTPAFGSFTPTALTNQYTPFGLEGSVVAGHPITGALMFYSDGNVVVDASQQVIPNGAALGGCSTSGSAAAIKTVQFLSLNLV